jgi:hypothetical protein
MKWQDRISPHGETPVSHVCLTPQQVRDIAHLARLELNENELEVMARQLGAIVDYDRRRDGRGEQFYGVPAVME